jgi:predicted dehydrogenase
MACLNCLAITYLEQKGCMLTMPLKRALLHCSLAGVIAVAINGQAQTSSAKTRLAIIGLNHDHVWGLLKDITKVPQAELIAIADPNPELIAKAKRQVPATVKFYSDYVKMLDEEKPDGVIITTETDHHLAIVSECAKRHINIEMEKPLATTADDARQISRLALQNHVLLMVNYVNNWFPSTQELYRRVKAGNIGPIDKIVVQFGHQGPREIGTSKEFAAWLYDPVKNGGGALMDFGCYGADLAVWLNGMPTKVFARSLTLKTGQHNAVEDDAVILLEYPNATALIEPSWDWPYTMERTKVFGLRGSLLELPTGLLYEGFDAQSTVTHPDGHPVSLPSLSLENSNPIAYYIAHIRTHKPIGGLLSGRLNVEVNEILDAAKESIRTGRAASLISN